MDIVRETMSRRIPDFVIKVLEVARDNGQPYVKREKIVLIVEIKIGTTSLDTARQQVVRTLRVQVVEQVVHAFRESADPARFGFIIGVGDLRYYTEYDRKVLKYAVGPRNGPDDAYVDPSEGKKTRKSLYAPSIEGLYTGIEPYFRGLDMLNLNALQSDDVIKKVAARVRQLSSEYWGE
ncbi:hypothetical protein DAEQUDRAFT_731091 [Daedalea quercina L-15889]|uniref:Uncharacterized protein n=1 Tax=Daedalea quercina L-15889 TaxID=1314783 RepID=A0A165MH10_9APHY|nr:hypothetical protein DAEQUDRAFT_731091 [Daedalea quercina L-15889]